MNVERKISRSEGIKILTENRRARHRYTFMERFEAGLVLSGAEVKSCRNGKIQLVDAYATVKNGELWLYNAHISAYSHARLEDDASTRPRKLLMRRKEIDRLNGKTREKGLTLIPTKMYLSNGYIKCEIALAKGKLFYDKRDQKRKAIDESEAREAVNHRR